MLAEADAVKYVFGYTVANDVTARDLQKKMASGRGRRLRPLPQLARIDTSFDPTNRTLRGLLTVWCASRARPR